MYGTGSRTAEFGAHNILIKLSEKKRRFFTFGNMFNSKMIALLGKLDPGERRRFRKWLLSPYHNANPLLSKFYDYIDERKGFTERSLKKERAFVFLFGNLPFNDLVMRRLMSDFLYTLEDFLAHEERRESPAMKALLRARLYRRRRLPQAAGRHIEDAMQHIREKPEHDPHFFLDAYYAQEERLRQANSRDAALNLQEMNDHLSAFFVAEMLRNACTAASHQAIYRVDYQTPYLEIILADCTAGKYDHIPVIRLYHLCYRCLTQPENPEAFHALKALLPKADGWLPQEELRNLTMVAINYCIRQVNIDTSLFMREVFDLYRTGLEQEIFMENGEMSRFTYKNIVSAALTLGETVWTEEFVIRYAKFLSTAYRSDYERFCTAKLRYAQKDHTAALALLHNLAFDDVLLELGARVLLLKIYFENMEWRLLHHFLTTFERFVSRKKMLAYHAPNYLNIIQLTRRMIMLCNGQKPATPEEISILLTRIKSTRPLTEREWLEDMLTRFQTTPNNRNGSNDLDTPSIT